MSIKNEIEQGITASREGEEALRKWAEGALYRRKSHIDALELSLGKKNAENASLKAKRDLLVAKSCELLNNLYLNYLPDQWGGATMTLMNELAGTVRGTEQ